MLDSETRRWVTITTAAVVVILLPQVFVESHIFALVLSISGICLLLWISEVVPPFVPTILLWTLVPIFLSPIDPKYDLAHVLGWAVDPVLALFFGGFVLGVATQTTGLGRRVVGVVLRTAGSSYARFLGLVILLTAFFSMWISNIAAAALVFSCLSSVLEDLDENHVMRRALLVAVALAADFGGMATPIGTGPNAIAIASLSGTQQISFVGWMAFAFPLTAGMLLMTFVFLLARVRGKTTTWQSKESLKEKSEDGLAAKRNLLIVVLLATAALWLTEPFHKIPSAVVALGSAALVFLSRILSKKDLANIDWSTLLLIAGGITLGRLLEQSAIVKTAATQIPFADFSPTLSLFLVCLVSATLAALMSNTATVILLIPLATALMPQPSTAILVAISASFGVPFIISTPPNAMAFGQGGLKVGDLFWPGIVMMVGGCALVAVTGRVVLNLAGIP